MMPDDDEQSTQGEAETGTETSEGASGSPALFGTLTNENAGRRGANAGAPAAPIMPQQQIANLKLLLEPNSPHRTSVSLAPGAYTVTCSTSDVGPDGPVTYEIDINGTSLTFPVAKGMHEKPITLPGGTMDVVARAFGNPLITTNRPESFLSIIVNVTIAP